MRRVLQILGSEAGPEQHRTEGRPQQGPQPRGHTEEKQSYSPWGRQRRAWLGIRNKMAPDHGPEGRARAEWPEYVQGAEKLRGRGQGAELLPVLVSAA